jgi:hypothetical protein
MVGHLAWNRVITTRSPGVAPCEPAGGVPRASQTAVHRHRLERVRRARRVVATDLPVERTDREPVCLEETDQEVLHEPTTRLRQRSSSSPRSRYVAPAAAGRARTTTTSPAASRSTRARIRWRRRRFTRLRVTAGPTARDTTKPTRPGSTRSSPLVALSTFVAIQCTTTSGPPARRPRRTARWNSAAELRRWLAESTPWPGLRQRGSCDPCDGEPTGSRDRRGCASAGGSRAPCAGGGCSAGTCACSRAHLQNASLGSVPRPGRTTQRRRQSHEQLAPPARARTHFHHARGVFEGVGRGHAAPVEPVSTCQRYAARIHRVNSSPPDS